MLRWIRPVTACPASWAHTKKSARSTPPRRRRRCTAARSPSAFRPTSAATRSWSNKARSPSGHETWQGTFRNPAITISTQLPFRDFLLKNITNTESIFPNQSQYQLRRDGSDERDQLRQWKIVLNQQLNNFLESQASFSWQNLLTPTGRGF